MSWSNQRVADKLDDIIRKVDDLTWHGVPEPVIRAIRAAVFEFPQEIPDGFELVVNTNGHVYFPTPEANFPPAYQVNISVLLQQKKAAPQPPYANTGFSNGAPVVVSTEQAGSPANVSVSVPNGTASNT